MDWEKLRDGITTFGEGVGKGFKRVFGSQTDRVVKGLSPVIRQFDIKSNSDISLNTILGNQVKIREWLI